MPPSRCRPYQAEPSGCWVSDMLKSAKSERTVPLTSWLADSMRIRSIKRARAGELTAPLWPNRAPGGSRRRVQLANSPDGDLAARLSTRRPKAILSRTDGGPRPYRLRPEISLASDLSCFS
jgi:hypothetical protein